MPVKLKIKVTKEILERSKMCEMDKLIYENCAIACAIKDIFPLSKVWKTYIELPFDIRIHLPQEAIIFISAFDMFAPCMRLTMQPIEFEIEIPDTVIEKINIEELRPLLENHPTLELINH